MNTRGWMGDTSGGDWGPDDGPDEDEKDSARTLEEVTQQHVLDEDACCIHCGFDAAEWWHLERHKPRDEREPQPECSVPQRSPESGT